VIDTRAPAIIQPMIKSTTAQTEYVIQLGQAQSDQVDRKNRWPMAENEPSSSSSSSSSREKMGNFHLKMSIDRTRHIPIVASRPV